MKKRLLPLVQLALGLGIITFILYGMHSQGKLGQISVALSAAATHWPYLLVATLSFGACLLLCNIRWWLLLRAQDLEVPFSKTLSLYLVGHFFNAFLLGAVGGDVAKAVYVARETHHKRAEAVFTVFTDRIVGLIALMGLTVVIMVTRIRFFLQYEQMRVALLVNLVILFGTVAGLILVLGRDRLERWGPFRRLEAHTKLGDAIGRAYRSFQFCLRHRRLLIRTLILSLLNHVYIIVSAYYIALALGLNISFLDCLTIFPVINAISSLPITPSGLGTREKAAIFLLGAIGVPDTAAVTLSLLLYAVLMFWSLVGGVVYLLYASKRGRIPTNAQ